jgi:hypothetical protein
MFKLKRRESLFSGVAGMKWKGRKVGKESESQPWLWLGFVNWG